MIVVHTEKGVLQIIQVDDTTVQVFLSGTEDLLVECEEIHITSKEITGVGNLGSIWRAQLVEAVDG
ncbi:MAG: hypothetical protein KJI69_00180 [Patescibacteria group bacterium]|nr:hypothetical protein [Patescibacteria group bacterium]